MEDGGYWRKASLTMLSLMTETKLSSQWKLNLVKNTHFFLTTADFWELNWANKQEKHPWFCTSGMREGLTISFISKHSDSLDTLLYVRFAIQNLEFYEWKIGDHGWALSWHRTHTHFALWPDVTSCFTYEKTESEEVFSIVSYIRFKNLQFHWEICSSIVSMCPYERGSVSTVVCHLFVVRITERSAVSSQDLCPISGEASANFERPSRSHFSLDSPQQAIVV